MASPAPDPGVAGLAFHEVIGELDGAWFVCDGADADGRPVRLWISTPDAADDPELRDRVACLARLRATPGYAEQPLAPLAGAGHDAGRLVIARRILSGPTLADRLAGGPLRPEEAVRLLSPVAGALETLHAFGIPHTHLTPDAVRLSTARRPTAALEYYGFPPPPAEPGDDESILEVAGYVAPEIAAGGPVTARSDVYALACLLVECLTGAPPFPADRPLFVLEAHRSAPPPRIAAVAALAPEIDDVLQVALAKRPEERHASAAALMRAVQGALGGRDVAIPVLTPHATARPATAAPAEVEPEPELADAPRRRRVPARLAATLVLAASTAAGFASATIPSASPERDEATAGRPTAAEARAAKQRRAAAVAVTAVDRAIDPLATTRATSRRRLHDASRPTTQAAAAAELATAYRDARRALPPATDLTAARPAPDLHPTLSSIEGAYRRLSGAATDANPTAFHTAAGDITAGERKLDRTLREIAQLSRTNVRSVSSHATRR